MNASNRANTSSSETPSHPEGKQKAGGQQATPGGYFGLTRTRTYSFLAALPLFVLYEALILLANQGAAQQVRVGADVWLKSLLNLIGGTGMLALGAVVVTIGVVVIWRDRKLELPFRPRYFGWMMLESTGYAVVFAFVVSSVVGALFALHGTLADPLLDPLLAQDGGGLAGQGTLTLLALSLGAGLYEELVFRLLLVGGLFALLSRVLQWKSVTAYTVAALVGAFLFSAVHYTGVFGDPFTLSSFTFRFLFGLVFNVIYLFRGFGIAAWTHAIYDILVVTEIL